MFKRKLAALEHVISDSFSMNDEKQVRSLVLWLEDQKIRHYKIEDRHNIRKIDSVDWKTHFSKYLEDVQCPFVRGELVDQLEWLIGYAVKLEYSDNVNKYRNVTSKNVANSRAEVPKMVSCSPLDNLDFECNDFKNGVKCLSEILNVTSYPNHLLTLQAVSSIISERLNAEAVSSPSTAVSQGVPFPFLETDSGFKTNNQMLSEVGKILKLLFIQDLRHLQTQINECIVAAQKVTADPKTDTKLGKVGF